MEIEVEVYETCSGVRPFEAWVENIRDKLSKAKIIGRLKRLRAGNFGDHSSVGKGVCELRVHYGPGFRVYYARVGNKIVLLLCGGDKGSQSRDIDKAREFLEDYQSRRENICQEVGNTKIGFLSN